MSGISRHSSEGNDALDGWGLLSLCCTDQQPGAVSPPQIHPNRVVCTPGIVMTEVTACLGRLAFGCHRLALSSLSVTVIPSSDSIVIVSSISSEDS